MHHPLVYYISAHGYGHGVRSVDILRAFHERRPDVPVILVSQLPRSFLSNRLQPGVGTYRAAAFDVGMVQHDSVRVDVDATLEQVLALYGRREEIVAAEADWLRRVGAGAMVCDIPALPLEAAARIALPRLAVGNFAWDWIYGPFAERDARWHALARQFAGGYGQAELLLKLPFSEEMSAFPVKEDLALVARPGTARREELAVLTGADTKKPWVLLSFTSLDLEAAALDRIESLVDYEFFTVMPLHWERRNLRAVRREDMGFSDIMASTDMVVSKPGFGLLSDCIVNAKPLLYVERTDFIEYPILVDAVEKYLRNLHIPGEDLYRGALGPYLERLPQQPAPPERIGHDGATTAASRIDEFYQRGCALLG